jgi:hypothetical protein
MLPLQGAGRGAFSSLGRCPRLEYVGLSALKIISFCPVVIIRTQFGVSSGSLVSNVLKIGFYIKKWRDL